PHQNFAEYVATRLRWARESVTDEHLLDLMGRVFPGARNVQMQLLPELQTTSLIASAIGRAVVLYASEQYPGNAARRIPKVLKIGPADEIAREIDRYERFVNGWLHQYRQARLENHARVWHLGAITYAFLGVTPHDMAPFRAFYLYPRSQSDVILGMLRQLFIETCHNWYAQEREQVPEMVLFDEYDNALELQERIEERLDTQTPTLTFEGIDAPLPNPAIWALETGRQIIFPTITTCITHGDLHGDNLFVDRNMQAWLVDFGRSGFGHALRDFVELEADIKLRLISRGGADLASLAALERSLLASSAPGEMLLPSAAVAANPALHKAFQVVAGLRHLAFLTTCIDNPLEYYHALLYETLYMATLRRLQNPVRERAWCSAALIVERLQKPAGAPGTSAALTDLTGASLAQQPSEQAIPALTARLRYLAFCETSVKLQAAMYNGGEGGVPATLQAGVSALGQAVTHTRHLLDSLRGNGGTAG
ncbi:MAG: phosphotransferase, partial [Anaerolineae bacterium]|nr:phosphotransferase [Anaerolineae bacterium]